MGYDLGIDLGTSMTRAAVSRSRDDLRLRPECVPLDGDRIGLVSALYLGEDGSVLLGEQAERRVLTEPDRVCRQLMRRLAGGAPVVVGGVAHRPEEPAAELLRYVLHRVAEREEEPAARVAVAHPASWDPHSGTLLVQALHELGHSGVVLVPEPAAAAAHLAARGQLEPGHTVAVFDFGCGSLDAAVIRRDGPELFTLLGDPVSIESPCGADLDEALFTHVLTELEDQVGSVDVDDPEVLTAMGHLLAGCVAAKEALSSATAVTVPVLLPGVHPEVRVTRPAFEALIRPSLQAAVEALCAVTDSVDVRPADVDAVLLVGGCARIPLVVELLTAELQRPVTVDPDATTAVALGSALAASRAPELAAEAATVPAGPVIPWVQPPPPASRRPARTRVVAAAAGLVTAVAVPLALMAGPESVRTGVGAEFRTTAPTTALAAPTPPGPLAPAPIGPGESSPAAAQADPLVPGLIGVIAPPPGGPTTSPPTGIVPLLSSKSPPPGSTAPPPRWPTRSRPPAPAPTTEPSPTPSPTTQTSTSPTSTSPTVPTSPTESSAASED